MNKRLKTFLFIACPTVLVIGAISLAVYFFNQPSDSVPANKEVDVSDSGTVSDEMTNKNEDIIPGTPSDNEADDESAEKPGERAKEASVTDAPETAQSPIPSPTPDADSEEEPDLPEFTPEPEMDPDTWDYSSSEGGNMFYTEREKTPEVMPYEIHVNKLANCITIYKRNKKGEYKKPVKAFVCSAGYGTPLGTYKTGTKYYWKAMIHGVWAQYATRITKSFLFHSVPYDTHKKDTLISSYYNRLGSTASAGCVRLSVADAKWLIENCPTGTTVVIYNDSDPGPLGKPKPIRVAPGTPWDPTDPDDRNPWNSDKTKFMGVKDRVIERNSGISAMSGVSVFDKSKNVVTTEGIKVSSDYTSSKCGSYTVTYKYKPKKGKKLKKTVVFRVVDTARPVISGMPSKYYVKDASGFSASTIKKMIHVTDNGQALSKDRVKVSYSKGKAVVTATDNYGHTTTFVSNIYEDSEAPEIKIKGETKDTYPISYKLSDSAARKRIKKVSDNLVKLSKNDVKVSITPSGWGLKVTYSVTDKAGNTAKASEKFSYETASIVLKNSELTINDISNTKALSKNVSVVSDVTGKKVKYSLSMSKTKLKATDEYKRYKVKYTATYSSQAGSKSTSATAVVSVPK